MTEWTHYAICERESGREVEPPDEMEMKFVQALHFARGRQWLAFAASWHAPYTRKYVLLNLEQLRILHISPATLNFVPALGDWYTFDWRAVHSAYDGVHVHVGEIRDQQRAETRLFRRWRIFASAYDVDTLVIWRGAALREEANDWQSE